MNKTLIIVFFLLLSCATCFAQTTFQGITPGKSTRDDVEAALGKPVDGAYPTPAGLKHVLVQYAEGVVDVIQVDLLNPVSRAGLIQKLKLPSKADYRGAAFGNKELQEMFGGNALVWFVYASEDEASGIRTVIYVSKRLAATMSQFHISSGPDTQSKQGGQPTKSTGNSNLQLTNADLPDYMRPPAGSASSDTRRGINPSSDNKSGCNGFAGTWETDFGTMTFTITDGDQVEASYEFNNGSIKGKVSTDGKVLAGTYIEDGAKGRFRFVLAPDGRSFSGAWNRTSGTNEPPSGTWEGRCIQK